jgi:hypothetical protein
MNDLVIPQALAQAIANYLSRQPFADVVELIQALQRLPKKTEPINMRAGRTD